MGQNNVNNQNSSKYKIIEQLGEGGFGKAYKVENKKDKNIYVMKKIPINTKNLEELKSIENEALILKEINSEYIVKYFESFIDNDQFNIVMEYCENKDLKSFINFHKDKEQLINEEVIYNIALDICSGIKEIHSKNLIHRDLKPENLFISKDYIIKIGDFGISKKLINMNYAQTQKGTFHYMAPEILNGQKYDKRIDIWALGCILYELFTLEFCFDYGNIAGLINNIIKGNHGKIDTNIYNIEWQNIIDSLLKVDYHERPDINEVIEKIEEIKKNNLIKKSNRDYLDNISLNILKRKEINKPNKLNTFNKNEILVNKEFVEFVVIDNILPEIIKEKDIKRYQILFAGDSGVGAKSSLILRLTKNRFSKTISPTIGIDFSFITIQLKCGKIILLGLCDFAGQEIYRRFFSGYYKAKNCIIILGFEVSRKETLLSIKEYWYPESKKFPNAKLIYLIGNKIDLEREVLKDEAKNFAEENNLRYFETSCLTGEGVQEFFKDLVTEISKI